MHTLWSPTSRPRCQSLSFLIANEGSQGLAYTIVMQLCELGPHVVSGACLASARGAVIVSSLVHITLPGLAHTCT